MPGCVQAKAKTEVTAPAKKADKKVFQDPKKITREDVNVERLRELENENRDLRIENEFLKELGRLQEAEKQQQRNK